MVVSVELSSNYRVEFSHQFYVPATISNLKLVCFVILSILNEPTGKEEYNWWRRRLLFRGLLVGLSLGTHVFGCGEGENLN